ncbi:MAG: hypothetical protein M0Z52_03960 [Actinomycetota bacterium]|nr:hypothetical protein [Actinomycetota bacterium]
MWQVDLAGELKSVRPTERKAIIAGYAVRTGLSVQRLYAIAKEHGFTSGRKKREDAGELKSEITDGQIDFVAALIAESARDKKGVIMPVERALQIAVDNGVIEDGQISVGRMQQILRERQVNKAALNAERPATEMRSLHPNHYHAIDASICVQYYLKNGMTSVMREREFYKNKPANTEKVKTRLIRYLSVDHFSGLFYPYYFDAPGESQSNLYDFLVKTWQPKGDSRYPFQGVPYGILWDRGSANISRAITALLQDGLEIELPDGMPYNKMRQGVVEVMHSIWEQWFESGLRFDPATSIEQLNAWAHDFAIWFCATKKHTRHGMTRSACWLQIKPEQLRLCPGKSILNDLFANPAKECTVDAHYNISFRGEEYKLSHVPGLFRGAKVQAVLKPYIWPAIEVLHNETRYQATPFKRLEGGFSEHAAIIGQEFKAPKETLTQQAEKRFENMAYGEAGEKKGAVPFEGITVFGNHADKVDITYIRKQGTPMEVDKGVADAEVPVIDLIREIARLPQDGKTKMTAALNASIRAEFGATVGRKKMEEVIEAIKAGTWTAAGKDSGQAGMTKDTEVRRAVNES